MCQLGSIGHGSVTVHTALFTEPCCTEPCYRASVNAVREANWRASETDNEREYRLAVMIEREANQRASETENEREDRLAAMR